jgi:Integrase core domain
MVFPHADRDRRLRARELDAGGGHFALGHSCDTATGPTDYRLRTAEDDNHRREFTSNAILKCADQAAIEWHYIAPGKSMENGFIENFNKRLHD